jgi:hypothetical protein
MEWEAKMATATTSNAQPLTSARAARQDGLAPGKLRKSRMYSWRKDAPAILLLLAMAALSIAVGVAHPEETAALMAWL